MTRSALFFDQDVVTARDASAFTAAHARLEVEDAARSRWLALVVRLGGRCQRCGATVSDPCLARHPGACSRCSRRGFTPRIRLRLEVVR